MDKMSDESKELSDIPFQITYDCEKDIGKFEQFIVNNDILYEETKKDETPNDAKITVINLFMEYIVSFIRNLINNYDYDYTVEYDKLYNCVTNNQTVKQKWNELAGKNTLKLNKLITKINEKNTKINEKNTKILKKNKIPYIYSIDKQNFEYYFFNNMRFNKDKYNKYYEEIKEYFEKKQLLSRNIYIVQNNIRGISNMYRFFENQTDKSSILGRTEENTSEEKKSEEITQLVNSITFFKKNIRGIANMYKANTDAFKGGSTEKLLQEIEDLRQQYKVEYVKFVYTYLVCINLLIAKIKKQFEEKNSGKTYTSHPPSNGKPKQKQSEEETKTI